MFPVYVAQSLADAELLRVQLQRAGIQSRLRNEFLQGALGELPVNLSPEVCVLRERDFEPAREVVAEFERSLRAPAESDWTCRSCGEDNPGNFELCWRCREDRSGASRP